MQQTMRLLLHRQATAGQTRSFYVRTTTTGSAFLLRLLLTLTNLNLPTGQRHRRKTNRLSPFLSPFHAHEPCAAQRLWLVQSRAGLPGSDQLGWFAERRLGRSMLSGGLPGPPETTVEALPAQPQDLAGLCRLSPARGLLSGGGGAVGADPFSAPPIRISLVPGRPACARASFERGAPFQQEMPGGRWAAVSPGSPMSGILIAACPAAPLRLRRLPRRENGWCGTIRAFLDARDQPPRASPSAWPLRGGQLGGAGQLWWLRALSPGGERPQCRGCLELDPAYGLPSPYWGQDQVVNRPG